MIACKYIRRALFVFKLLLIEKRIMLSTITFFLATTLILSVQSQTWTGTFTADSTCDRTVCCCLDGTIVITNSSTNMLSGTSGLAGVCANNANTLSFNTSFPSSYTSYITINGANITLTLSNNSNTIFASNPGNATCNGYAYRNTAIKQFGNFMALLALLAIGLTKIIF